MSNKSPEAIEIDLLREQLMKEQYKSQLLANQISNFINVIEESFYARVAFESDQTCLRVLEEAHNHIHIIPEYFPKDEVARARAIIHENNLKVTFDEVYASRGNNTDSVPVSQVESYIEERLRKQK